MNTAFIFPGQGSQTIGMGKDFYDNFLEAKEVFDTVEETLGRRLKNIIFYGPDNELTLTTNAQLALMTTSMSIITCMIKQMKTKINKICSAVAGHSLGEYSALCAAQVVSLTDITNILKVRAESMHEIAQISNGAMLACFNVNIDQLKAIITSIDSPGICEIANENSENQIVISGTTEYVNKVEQKIHEHGFKTIKLKVSAPFHSSLMKPVAEKLSIIFEQITLYEPIVPIIHNINARIANNVSEIKSNAINQTYSCVKWKQIINVLCKQMSISRIVEIGGNVLTRLLKNSSNLEIISIKNINEFDKYCTNYL